MLHESTILNRLRGLITEGAFSGPVSDVEIAVAESTLCVNFPRSYRLFLKHFGAARLRPPYEIAGLEGLEGRYSDRETPLWQSVVISTLIGRRASRGQIPPSYVAISDDGGDTQFYLDTSRRNDDAECPVIALGPGIMNLEIAQSFLDFVERLASGDQLL